MILLGCVAGFQAFGLWSSLTSCESGKQTLRGESIVSFDSCYFVFCKEFLGFSDFCELVGVTSFLGLVGVKIFLTDGGLSGQEILASGLRFSRSLRARWSNRDVILLISGGWLEQEIVGTKTALRFFFL